MTDPLAASSSPLRPRPSQRASATAHNMGANDPISARWLSLFESGSTPSIEALRQRSLAASQEASQEAKIAAASQDDASLRWIQWKLFLTQHISSIPSSWHALIQRDRDAYNHLRSSLLCAPDGNFPPQLGFDGSHTTLQSTSHSAASTQPTNVTPARSTHDLSVNNPLSLDDSNPWTTYYATLETRRLILQDVERTFPDLALFRHVHVQQSLTNILLLWALQNDDVGYRQGMHELAAVLWKVRSDGAVDARRALASQASRFSSQTSDDAPFDHALADVFIEHDVYALFCALMHSAKSWYAWRHPSPAPAAPAATAVPASVHEAPPRALPIVAKCEAILDQLRRIDPALAQHLESLGIEPQLFCLRWIRMIFTREFALDDALLLWDGLFAADAELALIDHVCIAMLLRIRNQLLAADHTSALQCLLRYPQEAHAQPHLLIRQAVFIRKAGDQPSTGVAVVMQNRDALNIAVAPLAAPDQGVAQHSPPKAHRAGAARFATVGRAPSGSARSPWSRMESEAGLRGLDTGVGQRPEARRWQAPADGDPLGAVAADTNGGRAFGINPSAYVPEGFSDLAKGWYERAELPQSLNSALVNVSRTVAAAAGAYRTNKPESSGFPSGFDQAFSSQAALRTTGSAATVGHAAADRTARPRLATVEPAELPEAVPREATAVPQSEALDSKDPVAKLTAANRAMGSALAVCIQVLEQSWLDRPDAPSDEVGQTDVGTLTSFTALKHIRDVLGGAAAEFDPATLPDLARAPGASPPRPRAPTAAVAVQPAESIAQEDKAQDRLREALPMALGEYARYGRQMILPDFGLPGQLRLRRAKVLVVGAGGLGCPAIQYLAAAGVGRISILDHDVVEASNLARQILHDESSVGVAKAVSAARAVARINPHVVALPLQFALTAANARDVMRGHDLVLDCTDNPLTRYLVSDAAVLERIEVVSGAAQGYDGQLVVLHKRIKPEFAGPKTTAEGETRGPCYRCLFPKAPKPDEVTNCEDGGVLGGVTGLVGTMQALEATKILAGIGEETPPTLTLVAPMTTTPFRCVRIRPRRVATCRACGDPTLVQDRIQDLEQEDYVSFCGLHPPTPQDELPRTKVPDMNPNALIVDVRPNVEFNITCLNHSINLPFQQLIRDPQLAWNTIKHQIQSSNASEVLLVCKKGNDSQLALRSLLNLQKHQRKIHTIPTPPTFPSDPLQAPSTPAPPPPPATSHDAQADIKLSDLVGGLRAYAALHPAFPIY